MEETFLPTVAVACTEPPDPVSPCTALHRLIDNLGGIEPIIASGDQVLILVNLHRLHSVSYLCVVAGIADMVAACGGRVLLGDSPWLSRGRTDELWRQSGIKRLAQLRGWRLVTFEREPLSAVAVDSRVYHLPSLVTTVDRVINVAPVMQHRRCRLAAGIFNLFGVVPGYKSGQFAPGFTCSRTFASIAVDILSIVMPDLTILDASPVSRHTVPGEDCRRRLIASTDTVAADAIAAATLGFKPERIRMVRLAAEAGLGIGWPEGILQRGDTGYPLRPDQLAEFDRDTTLRLPSPVARLAEALVSYRPAVDAARCDHCATCVTGCPTGALRYSPESDTISFHQSLCVSCYTCVEHCPNQAVHVRPSWLAGLLQGAKSQNLRY